MPGRDVARRVRICGTLRCMSAVAVGGLGVGNSDMPFALNGRGRPYVPGTSLAGALRAWANNRWSDQQVRAVFGDAGANGESGARDLGIGASRLVIDDAVIPSTAPEVRDGVGIDRLRGAAAEGVKYDREVLPRGTEIPLILTVEVPATDENRIPDLLDELVKALGRGEVLLGAAQTGGLGRVRLAEANRTEEDLSTRAGLLQMFDGDAPAEDLALPDVPGSTADIVIEISWVPDLPVMLASGLVGGKVDTVPLLSGTGFLSPVIPGSSLKGVLRSQAERIVRTLRPDIPAAAKFLDQVRVPIVERLFGSAAVPTGREDADDTLGRGGVRVNECYASLALDPDGWSAFLSAPDSADLYEGLGRAELAADDGRKVWWSQAHHVAIDRWTGGAADRMLFSTLEPWRLDWDAITLEVDPHRLGPELEPSLALLMLVVRDLALGRLAIGWATRRGFGSIEVREINLTVRGESLPPLKATDVSASGLGPLIAALDDRLDGSGLAESWRRWVGSRPRIDNGEPG
jgi:CRISPR/Cas system CSM-associated protein Csm3 (group 7 of RAMP superfamily)